MSMISRRKLIAAGIAVSAGASGLAGAAKLAQRYGLIPPDYGGIYGPGETLTYAAQRILTYHSLAREFPPTEISKKPFQNGKAPQTAVFKRLENRGFVDWRLTVDGLVMNPRSFSLSDIKSQRRRSQITHLACEEGWSFIAEWIGVPLHHVLEQVGIRPQAKYVIYSSIEPGFWDSIDMNDALHPQTLVTFGMNGGELPVGHGGPLRLRVPRQLGYKSLKYITRLTVTDDIKRFGTGVGSPSTEYAWYAGI
jgi:DMSO/TMAO reductase YedYZ molybdopterin-dependent catalytic subunit